MDIQWNKNQLELINSATAVFAPDNILSPSPTSRVSKSKSMKEMEKIFNCPVIESYGMTETSHQMTSNLLPPGIRKALKVGVAAGPEVAIIDNKNNFLPKG